MVHMMAYRPTLVVGLAWLERPVKVEYNIEIVRIVLGM